MDVDLEKGVSPSSGSGGAAADDGRHPQCTCGSGRVNSCYRHYTFGLPDTSVGSMFLVSLLFVAIAAAQLRRAHLVEPPPLEQTVHVVWKVSLLVCSYLGLWTYTLSRTMGAAAVFFRATYAAMLACAAGALVGPVAGVAAAHLCTAWAAGLLGYALAEHRMHVGSERAADEAAARTPTPSSLTKGHKLTVVHGIFVAGLTTLVVGARVAWLVLSPGGGGYHAGEQGAWFAVVELSATIFSCLYLWAMCAVKFLLHEALVSLDYIMRACLCCSACSALSALSVVVSHWIWVCSALSALGTVVSQWLWAYCLRTEMMAMAAFCGYIVAVNARCKEILAREGRRQLCLADLGDDDDSAAEASQGTDVGGASACEGASFIVLDSMQERMVSSKSKNKDAASTFDEHNRSYHS